MPLPKKFWLTLTVLLCVAIALFFTHNRSAGMPQRYEGYISLEPESKRSKPYISFHLLQGNTEQKYMVLIKKPESFALVESMLGRKVQVKAFIYKHEPSDFDKIEIIEITPL